MQNGHFSYPLPPNEPVMSYAPGSPEKLRLKAVLQELKALSVDVPMVIGGKEVRTGKKVSIRPPHEHQHVLGYFHEGDAGHVSQAIDAALSAKESWASMSWESRAQIFVKAADLIAGKYRPYMNGTTMLGQSKNVCFVFLDVVFVFDFTDDFLQDIFNGDQASNTAVFINNNGDVIAVLSEIF
jgi:1-pyrroline-5-carboxylate dehydrogenase